MGESFENLKVWPKAHELMLFVHRLIEARHLEYISSQTYQKGRDLASEVQRLLNGYIDYLKREKPGKDEPGIDINVDRGHVNFDNDDLPSAP